VYVGRTIGNPTTVAGGYTTTTFTTPAVTWTAVGEKHGSADAIAVCRDANLVVPMSRSNRTTGRLLPNERLLTTVRLRLAFATRINDPRVESAAPTITHADRQPAYHRRPSIIVIIIIEDNSDVVKDTRGHWRFFIIGNRITRSGIIKRN